VVRKTIATNRAFTLIFIFRSLLLLTIDIDQWLLLFWFLFLDKNSMLLDYWFYWRLENNRFREQSRSLFLFGVVIEIVICIVQD